MLSGWSSSKSRGVADPGGPPPSCGSQPLITSLTCSLERQLEALGAIEVPGGTNDAGRSLGLTPEREDAGEQETTAL